MSATEEWLAAYTPQALETLTRFCRIESVSTDPAYKAGIEEAAQFVAAQLRDAGFPVVDIEQTGGHPAVVAEWCEASGAPTVLIYGHYDVQPPDPIDAWTSPPFAPTIRNDRLYARGVSDDKGPLLIPIVVIKAFYALQGKLPLNIKVIIEGEEESGSPHLSATVARLKDRLACDLVVSADGAMWRADIPSVTVASRGLIALEVNVMGATKDLHSGRHGGSAPNPIRALTKMLASLHDEAGKVTVPGFLASITEPDPLILQAIYRAKFDPAAYFDSIGAPHPEQMPSGEDLLTRQWLIPTLEFNGISGGYAGTGTKTVIPSTASAKITCRLVTGQDPEAVRSAIEQHLRGILPTGYAIEIGGRGPGSAAFSLNPSLPALAATEAVLAELLGAQPLRVAMGATIPIGEVFRTHLGAEMVFFSFSTSDEDYHAPNEFLRLSNFRLGMVAWARLIERLTKL
jgi:acetylornithine deacetylase/succinyl-diaminopimelate desuccinylase-like protein